MNPTPFHLTEPTNRAGEDARVSSITYGALPCPFCGGINIVPCGHHLFCFSCGAEGPDADTKDIADTMAHWNQRFQIQGGEK